MGYLKIPNLYNDQTILRLKEVWITEKVHGTSAWITYHGDMDRAKCRLDYHPGGAEYGRFVKLFDEQTLLDNLHKVFDCKNVRIHGEHYGGKIQKMSETYGKSNAFVVFDFKVSNGSIRDGVFLSFDKVLAIGEQVGLEVVDGRIVDCTIEELDKARDEPSVQSVRNGIEDERHREGIVIRPLDEMTLNNGERLITKHKGDAFRETETKRTARKEVDPKEFETAEAITREYVVPMRFAHVIDAFYPLKIEKTGDIIKAMIADIIEEEGVEITPLAKKAIAKKTVDFIKQSLRESASSSHSVDDANA